MTVTTGFSHDFQCISFRLDDSLIGINILDIREIVPCRRVTRISNAPRFVLGLMNLRGQILTVLDVGILLGLEKRKVRETSHVIIFKQKNVGFVVDRIGDVIGIRQADIERVPANIDPVVQEYTDHVVNLPDGILMLLNAQKLLSKTLRITAQTKEA